MIDLARIAHAVRAADEETKTSNLDAWAKAHDVVLTDLHYVAIQRALRCAAMLVDGVEPSMFDGGQMRKIALSPMANSIMPILTAAFIDGFATGLTVSHAPERRGDRKRAPRPARGK